MNKLIKIALIIFGTLLYLVTLVLAIRLYNFQYPTFDEKIDVTKLSNYHFEFTSHGKSMTDYGITDGSTLVMYPNKKCNVGDICGIECLTKKCNNDGDTIFTKKIISIDNNCYFFQGNKNPLESWDSRYYGCLKPDEFKMWGIVVIP